ncbi:MAG: TldD/PmbA family protein, partial [Thermoplasmata archaeon]
MVNGMMHDYSERIEYALAKTQTHAQTAQAEVFLGANNLLTIRSAVGKVLESKIIQDAGLGIRILTKDAGLGFSSTCDFSDQALDKAIREALAIAKYRKVDSNYSFATPQTTNRTFTHYDKKLVETIHDYTDINAQVNQMIVETLDKDAAITEAAGPTHLVEYSKNVMNTNGVDVAEKGTFWKIELMAIAESATDRREGSHSSSGYALNEIETASLSDHAADMAVRALDGQKVEAGTYEMIFSSMSVSTLLGWLGYVMVPQNQERNMPLLKDKIGEQIAFEGVTMGHDPLRVSSPVSGAYDDEGVPTRDIALIKDGVHREIPLDTYYATGLNTQSNGNAYRSQAGSGMTSYPGQLYQSEPLPLLPAVYMEGGTSSIDEMIASTQKGIYLVFLHYAYITNGGTGDYTGILRQGTFLIENGEITVPIQKCRLL